MPILDNPRHENVCQELAKGNSVLKSYQTGGFKGGMVAASLFCKKPFVKERVKEIQQDRIHREMKASQNAAESLGIDKRWVLQRLQYNAERCLRGKPILDKNGEQIPGRFTGMPDSRGANEALELIGREIGMFIQKVEVGGPGDFSRLTDEELAAKIASDAAALGVSAEATEALLLTFQPKDSEEVD